VSGRLRGNPLDFEKYYMKFGQAAFEETLYGRSQIYWRKFYEAILGSEENLKFLKRCTMKMQ
jgi:hypothetical protein